MKCLQRPVILNHIVGLVQAFGPFHLGFHDGGNLVFRNMVAGHGALHLQFCGGINHQNTIHQVLGMFRIS